MKTRFAVANLITTKAGGAPKAAGGGYSLRQLLGYLWRAYHIRWNRVRGGFGSSRMERRSWGIRKIPRLS